MGAVVQKQRIVLFVLSGLSLIGASEGVFAESATGPSYKLDASQTRVVEVTNLYADPECHPARLRGRVISRKFDGNGTTIKGMTIEETDGSRIFVNTNVDLEGMSMVDAAWVLQGLQLLSKKGAKISLGVKLCGAAGRVIVVDSVNARNDSTSSSPPRPSRSTAPQGASQITLGVPQVSTCKSLNDEKKRLTCIDNQPKPDVAKANRTSDQVGPGAPISFVDRMPDKLLNDNGSNSIWTNAFSRRNYKIGMTLRAFKRVQYPDQKEWPNAFPVCSNEIPPQLANDPNAFGLKSHNWKGLGVIMCEFFYHSNVLKKLEPAGLMLGNVSPISDKFYFYPNSQETEPVLFLVRSTFPSDRFEETMDAFQQLLGEPKTKANQPVQNKLGNTFQNTTILYENDVSLILLQRFGESLRKSDVQYVAKPLYDAVVKADEAMRGRPRDRL